jgi:hypothetical protein
MRLPKGHTVEVDPGQKIHGVKRASKAKENLRRSRPVPVHQLNDLLSITEITACPKNRSQHPWNGQQRGLPGIVWSDKRVETRMKLDHDLVGKRANVLEPDTLEFHPVSLSSVVQHRGSAIAEP